MQLCLFRRMFLHLLALRHQSHPAGRSIQSVIKTWPLFSGAGPLWVPKFDPSSESLNFYQVAGSSSFAGAVSDVLKTDQRFSIWFQGIYIQCQYTKLSQLRAASWQEFCIVCFSFHCCNFAILILAILEYRNPEVKKIADWVATGSVPMCSNASMSLRHKAATKPQSGCPIFQLCNHCSLFRSCAGVRASHLSCRPWHYNITCVQMICSKWSAGVGKTIGTWGKMVGCC